MNLDKQDFIDAIDSLGINGSEVCIHSSMKSFRANIKCGIEGIINSFLDQKCTIMVPTFSDIYEARPIPKYMPERNGAGDYSYFFNKTYADAEPFEATSKEISVEDMGIFSKCVLDNSKSVRGNHPLNSFTALGRHAGRLVSCQTWRDVYAPFKQLCEDDGYVLLIGVGLSSATIIHYAEQVAGRHPFIRWSVDKNKEVSPVSAGGCSEGFDHFNNALCNFVKKVKVAESEWKCYKARDIVDACSECIRKNPEITHCGDICCDRCNDAVQGGCILSDNFWNK